MVERSVPRSEPRVYPGFGGSLNSGHASRLGKPSPEGPRHPSCGDDRSDRPVWNPGALSCVRRAFREPRSAWVHDTVCTCHRNSSPSSPAGSRWLASCFDSVGGSIGSRPGSPRSRRKPPDSADCSKGSDSLGARRQPSLSDSSPLGSASDLSTPRTTFRISGLCLPCCAASSARPAHRSRSGHVLESVGA